MWPSVLEDAGAELDGKGALRAFNPPEAGVPLARPLACPRGLAPYLSPVGG